MPMIEPHGSPPASEPKTEVPRVIVRDDYPEDGWLRGYFFVGDESGHTSAAAKGPAWKNIDYMRLRDAALHRLNPRPGDRRSSRHFHPEQYDS